MDQLKVFLALYGTDMVVVDQLCRQHGPDQRRVLQVLWHSELISDACADHLEDAGYWS